MTDQAQAHPGRSVPSGPCAPTTRPSGRTRRRTPSRGRGSAAGRCCSPRRGPASACSTSAAAPAASSPPCATRAPTRSASRSPRRRSSARAATRRAPTCGCSSRTARCRSSTASVDLVWCSEVLEHVADTEHLLLEARRVLRPGGRLLVTVPFHGRVKAALIGLLRFDAHFDPLGQHLRFYTRSLARAHARRGGVRRRSGAAVGRPAAAAHRPHGAGAAPVARRGSPRACPRSTSGTSGRGSTPPGTRSARPADR